MSPEQESDSEDLFLYDALLSEDTAEEIECYYADGLHPVHLNDIVSASSPDNSRYRILHKLGSGCFSTVWFGQNLEKTNLGHRGVAIKFIASDQTGKTHEVEISKYLASRSSEESGFQNFALCLDTFQVNGPNGVHDVIVSEPAILLADLFDNEAIGHLDDRLIFQQALAGVGFLHRNGVVHRDLHLRNMAIEFPFLRTARVTELMSGSGRPRCHAFVPSKPTPARHPPSFPTYIVEKAKFCGSEGLSALMRTSASFTVKIIDFGCSFRPGMHELPDPKEGPPFLKPPECNRSTMIVSDDVPRPKREANTPPRDLSDLAWSTQSDIWVLGCTLFSIMVRGCFYIFGGGFGGTAALFHYIAEYMGPVPDRYRLLLEETANSNNSAISESWDSKNCAKALDMDPALSEPSAIQKNWVSLEERVLDARRTRPKMVPAGDHVDEEQERKRVRVCLMVIRRMVGWCPEDRITASDAAALLAGTNMISDPKPSESPILNDLPESPNRETTSLSSLENQNSEYLWEPPSPPEDSEELEPLSRYRAGGLHPVHLTERYNNGQYYILNKLGFGSSSHVWLAQDTTTEQPLSKSRPLALKFIEAKASHDRTLEIEIHKYLTDLTTEADSKHILPLLDTFRIQGPNGMHNVIVSDAVVLIPDLCKSKTLEDLNETEIVRQIFQGVSFLHENGVVHRDLHCGNIGIEIPPFRTAGIGEFPRSSPLVYPCILSEAVEHPRSLPKYLVQSVPTLYFKKAPLLVVKLVDFGCAFRPGIDTVPEGGPRRALTAPECLVSETPLPEKVWTFQSDIWTLGCTLSLFSDGSLGAEMVKLLGPIPDAYRCIIDDNASPVNSASDTSEYENVISLNWRTLEPSLVAARAPRTPLSAEDELQRVGRDIEDVRRFLSLIKQMLRWEPRDRIKAKEALESVFFTSRAAVTSS
ncbi:kinase-like domain-containing protein [Roridomyces roridus]|uniref:Kinase-like domain-containing protein n=1 Tax=Roridomyces roridus TaxID=1738132 RepID=A0AAD7FG43_9AGAR|nr:kinase-like domain-containing protein [Roridomyces roridus]